MFSPCRAPAPPAAAGPWAALELLLPPPSHAGGDVPPSGGPQERVSPPSFVPAAGTVQESSAHLMNSALCWGKERVQSSGYSQ